MLISADSKGRNRNETWLAYCERSCFEVDRSFERSARETDFEKKASAWAEWSKLTITLAETVGSALQSIGECIAPHEEAR